MSVITQYDQDLKRSNNMYLGTGDSFWQLTEKELKDLDLFAIIRYYEELGKINACKTLLQSQLRFLPKS